jgi:HD-like signal output (HDOD) protein
VSVNAQQTAADLVQQLAKDLNNRDLELPTFPEAVVRIQRALQSPDAETGKIVRIVSSDPALAARILQIANSAAMRTSNKEIVDVRRAVVHMGFKLVQSTAVAFALRQMERNEALSAGARKELKAIWDESVELAALCFVIAQHYTKLNPEEALLAGLLSVLGRLYIFMKWQEYGDVGWEELAEILNSWHPAIAKAIAETWGMSEPLAEALEHQLEPDLPVQESATLAEVLSASRLIHQHTVAQTPLEPSLYPLVQRLGIAGVDSERVTLDEHADQIAGIRNALTN